MNRAQWQQRWPYIQESMAVAGILCIPLAVISHRLLLAPMRFAIAAAIIAALAAFLANLWGRWVRSLYDDRASWNHAIETFFTRESDSRRDRWRHRLGMQVVDDRQYAHQIYYLSAWLSWFFPLSALVIAVNGYADTSSQQIRIRPIMNSSVTYALGGGKRYYVAVRDFAPSGKSIVTDDTLIADITEQEYDYAVIGRAQAIVTLREGFFHLPWAQETRLFTLGMKGAGATILPIEDAYRGLAYYEGYKVPQDKERGVAFYIAAANADDAIAQYQLYLISISDPAAGVSEQNGRDCLKRAAERGLIPAMTELATLYAYGTGLPVDIQQTYTWLAIAARLGNAKSAASLIQLAPQLSPPQRLAAQATADAWKPAEAHPR
ncbi:MAG: tetratricopeptide repeat protein [Rickettsiales bacterium]